MEVCRDTAVAFTFDLLDHTDMESDWNDHQCWFTFVFKVMVNSYAADDKDDNVLSFS